MNAEIEEQIKKFVNTINNKLDKNEQIILSKIMNNYINLSKNLNTISKNHKKQH